MTLPAGQRVIVVIEDSDEDHEITLWALRQAGVTNRVLRCHGGAAIDELFKDGGGRPGILAGLHPLLVLLDLNLPGTDRYQPLERLRSHPWWRFVPVVVMSTSRHPNDLSKCYGLGAAGYLPKLLDLDAFAAAIETFAAYWLRAVVLPGPINRLPSSRPRRPADLGE